MTCEEIKILLHDYVDELLDENSIKLVYNHIHKCESCRDAYLKLMMFFDLLKNIEYTVESPKEVIEMLSKELLQKSIKEVQTITQKSKLKEHKLKREQKKQDRILKINRGPVRKSRLTHTLSPSFNKKNSFIKNIIKANTIIPIIVILIIGVGYFIYDFSLNNSPWEIKLLQGSYFIDDKRDFSGLWNKKSFLKTDRNTIVSVNVPNSCRLQIFSDSKIFLLNARNNDNIIKLDDRYIR